MTTRITISAGLAAALALAFGGPSYAQTPSVRPLECPKADAPAMIEGQVVKVDPTQGLLTVRAPDGTAHDFHASRETLQDTKVGDKISAKLRVPKECRRG